jgi:hypothetical protein
MDRDDERRYISKIFVEKLMEKIRANQLLDEFRKNQLKFGEKTSEEKKLIERIKTREFEGLKN